MFTKNIKTIAIVAVALVIAILVSCLVAVNNDKKVAEELAGQLAGQVQQNATNTQSKIDALNKTIADLKATLEKAEAGLASADEAIKAQQALIDALKDAGVKVENWEAASAVMIEKFEEVEELVDSYVNYYDEKTNVSSDDIYGYLDTEESSWRELFYMPYQTAMYGIMRATTVEEMDAIVEALEAEFDAVPTHYEALYAVMEEIEADDVTYDDYDNIKLAGELFATAHNAFFAPATEETEAEVDVIAERLAVVYTAFKPLVVEKVVELVAALPAPEATYYAHKDALKAAEEEIEFLDSLEWTEEEFWALQNNEDFVAAGEKYIGCAETFAVVEVLYNDAVALNKALADAAKAEDWAIKADRATRDNFNALYTLVEAWALEVVAAGYYDAETNTFDSVVLGYYDATIMAGYEAELAKAAGTMSTEAVKFINTVAAIEKITNESKAELDAAVAAYVAFTKAAGNYSPADVDYILGVEENGVVAAWNTLAGYQTAHADILATIKALEDYVATLFVKCTVNHGTNACDCKNIGDRNNVAFVSQDALIAKIVGFYGLEETVFNADALAKYKAVRLEAVCAQAIANAEAAYAASTNEDRDTILANLKTFIALAAKTEYKFEVKMTCTDPENKDHKCNCAADLANYSVVEDAATKALKVFTVEYCTGFFAEK